MMLTNSTGFINTEIQLDQKITKKNKMITQKVTDTGKHKNQV